MAEESASKRQKGEGRVVDSRPYSWPYDRDLRPENTVSGALCTLIVTLALYLLSLCADVLAVVGCRCSL